MPKNTSGILKSAQKKSEQTHAKAIHAITQLEKQEKEINICAVAEKAGISRTYIYRHQDIYDLIAKKSNLQHKANRSFESTQVLITLQSKTIQDSKHENKTLKSELEKCRKRCQKLQDENEELRQQINRLLGEKYFGANSEKES